MGLIGNGYRHNLTGRLFGATALDGGNPSILRSRLSPACKRNIFVGEGIADDLAAVPNGNRYPSAWIMPRKAGGLASHNESAGSVPTASLALAAGRNIAGQADGATTAADATLQLVVSLLGTSAGAALAEGNARAALALAATAAGGAAGAAVIGALAWAVAEAAGSSTATLTRYATGRLAGSITPFTELSPENLAAAVMAAAEAAPIHADVRKVNAYAVTGDGQTGSEWGPA